MENKDDNRGALEMESNKKNMITKNIGGDLRNIGNL